MIAFPTTIDDIKANREEWAQALESGTYKQSFCGLRNSSLEYDGIKCLCPIGVLVDITMPGTWAGPRFHPRNPDDQGQVWSVSAGKIVGLTELLTSHIGWLNDMQRLPFVGMAVVIRSLPLPTEVPA